MLQPGPLHAFHERLKAPRAHGKEIVATPASGLLLAIDHCVAFAVSMGREVRRSAMTFTRITINPDQIGGVPDIRGLRIPVATVVGMLADRMAAEEILDADPDLEPDDLTEALRYAAEAVRERELPLTPTNGGPPNRFDCCWATWMRFARTWGPAASS